MPFLEKLFLLLRIPHWTKAIFVFLGVIYANKPEYWLQALCAAFAFNLVASAVYIYNDLQDIEEDKSHPNKSHRPIASGAVSTRFALTILVICLISGLGIGLAISPQLLTILCVYLIINIFYNHWLRDVPYLDVLCVASGFMLRILAGTLGIGLQITWWLTVTATLLSMFIAVCKRRLEMKLGLQHGQRAVLKKYNQHALDLLIASTASGCFISYLLYTVYARQELLYFLWTLPFCVFGLYRFAYLTISDGDNDDPISLLFQDNLSRLNLLCFVSLTLLALWQ